MSACPLTSTQLHYVLALADGDTVARIAEDNAVSQSNVRSHLSMAYKALGVPSGAAAVALCFRSGWIVTEPTTVNGNDDRATVPVPPFAAAYEHYVGRYLDSRERDRKAKQGMEIAMLGIRTVEGLS